jgi:hypothetical protein
LRSGFDAVPGGLGGVLDSIKLLGQLGRLVAQRLEFGFGLRLDRLAGAFDFGGELIQVLVERVLLTLHCCDEFRLLREGVILHILRSFFRSFVSVLTLPNCFCSLSQPTANATTEKNVTANGLYFIIIFLS